MNHSPESAPLADRPPESTEDHSCNWLQHRTIRQIINLRVSGDPNVSTMQWFKEKYFPDAVDLALSFGCGSGEFERFGVTSGIAQRFHAHDLSEDVIGKARAFAAQEHLDDMIDYSVSSLEDCSLPASTYDAIFTRSSIHRVFQLENVFRRCRKALKPNGLLFIDEYIGPSRLQDTPQLEDLINQLHDIFPKRYRKSLPRNDDGLGYPPPPIRPQPAVKDFRSEAVRSGAIISTLRMYFDILEYRPYGGALMQMLFADIIGNFNEDDEGDVTLVRTVGAFEEVMQRAGAVGSNFAVIVAKPREVSSELSQYA